MVGAGAASAFIELVIYRTMRVRRVPLTCKQFRIRRSEQSPVSRSAQELSPGDGNLRVTVLGPDAIRTE
jgi:hypothetical protein